jgi:dTDP-4-dehydrorhamnose 3,5-epimerase
MEMTNLGIADAWLISSPVHTDDRGSFREWFKASEIFDQTGQKFDVAQGNLSQSKKGVVRGIHYSLAVEGQAKLVTCVSGAIRDIIVDIRPTSLTYGKYVAVDLIGGSDKNLLVGVGLGHAFVSMVDGTNVAYLVSSPFSPTDEFEINPLDPVIGIEWGLPLSELLFSPKDASAPNLSDRNSQGKLPRFHSQ